MKVKNYCKYVEQNNKHCLMNLIYKSIFIKLALIDSDLCLKQVFENPTLSRSAHRRSVVNSARCLLQFPLIVRDAF
jgi:hypothetical protein